MASPTYDSVSAPNAVYDSDAMPGSDDMPTRFDLMPTSPTNPPDNLFCTANISSVPVDAQPTILPPIIWSVATQRASDENVGGVNMRLPGLKELGLSEHRTSFNQVSLDNRCQVDSC